MTGFSMVPAPLTPLQKRILVSLSVVVALTRLAAISLSPFDWDEMTFSLGVGEYDVAMHRPHPPGYPLFIAAAKLVHLLGVSEFRSLQVIVLLGACFVFPALFFFARELGFDFATAAGGAAIFAFLPNVVAYGGTGFSDVPAAAVVFTACALLLRGRRNPRSVVAGALLLGVAAGIRPANLLVGAVPALLATWSLVRARAWRTLAAAIAAGLAVIVVSYAGAAFASASPGAYVNAVHLQSDYVRDVDSWRNPQRPPLTDLLHTFFVLPFHFTDALETIAMAAALGLVVGAFRRHAAPLVLLITFLPLAITSWLNLDYMTAARYAIGYMAAHALLAAYGFGFVLRKRVLQGAMCAITAAVFFVWIWPGLRTQRTTSSPVAAAFEWVRVNVPRDATSLYVSKDLAPHAMLLIPDHHPVFFNEPGDIPATSSDSWVLDWRPREGAQLFAWPHDSLWRTIRRRNFEMTVGAVASDLRFIDGWYDVEGPPELPWRWMTGRSRTLLPPLSGAGTLSLKAELPLELLARKPTIEVRMNGEVLGRFVPESANVERSWNTASVAKGENVLDIAISETIVPAHSGRSADTRSLGLRVDSVSWIRAR